MNKYKFGKSVVHLLKKRGAVLLLITGLLSLAFVINCDDRPIFTDLETANLSVVIKGTYASSTPAKWSNADFDGGFIDHTAIADDSIDDNTAGASDVDPSLFMLDIAEIRLVDDAGDEQKFANYRQGFITPLDDDAPFFNGTGIALENDDVPPGNYIAAFIYVRKMIFNGAILYGQNSSGWYKIKDQDTVFFEEDVLGFNFNSLQTAAYTDTLRYETSNVNRVFPIMVVIPGGFTVRSDTPTVLEIRMLINRFVKKYEYDYYDGEVPKTVHYFGPSDWLRDVKPGGTITAKADTVIGGNLPVVARMYEPGTAGRITINNAKDDTYYIAIPQNNIDNYWLNTSAYSDRGNVTADCDVGRGLALPGSYPAQYIDYYLRYEEFKEMWNTKAGGANPCNTLATYTSNWDNYLNEVGSFNIAPHAVYCRSAGTVYIENVPPGIYYVFEAVSPGYGRYFEAAPSDAALAPANPVIVGVGQNVTVSF
jgi:hypothetical protein